MVIKFPLLVVKIKLFATLLLIWITSALSADVVSYDGFKVYRLYPKTLEDFNLLNNYQGNKTYDFWVKSRMLGAPVDVMVNPASQYDFEEDMEAYGMQYKLLVNNVLIILQEENKNQRISFRNFDGEVSFTRFMRHGEINTYLRKLATDHPDIVTPEVIGKSYEGRDLLLIKISSGGTDKPTIYIEATIHAREWITAPVALYVIKQLVEVPENKAMYEDVDWVILPVVNPDGYEYTHTTDRFWRKTRSKGRFCYGVDPNRNFDYKWMVAGASNWECSEIYAGCKPFSEPETKAVVNYVMTHKSIKLFLDLHSFGRYILFPWGYTHVLSDDNDLLLSLGERVNDAIKAVGGISYQIGTSTNLMGRGAGGSEDYAKGAAGINFSYCVELPGDGRVGFSRPASSILGIVKETWEGFKVFHQFVQETYVNN